jgi:EAL domain-containing protein (putative c-di-GMP-specific phosphodiesterase class I)
VTAGELLRDADTAMYRAKANTPGGFELFESSMHARQLARLELDAELRQAMARKQLVVEYQPLVELRTGRTVGAEALLRWHHPSRDINPAEFIRLAEESGQIVAIGRWVLQEACREAAGWRRALPAFRVSVNISVRELAEPGYVAAVRDALSSAALPPDGLTLEITESLLRGDHDSILVQLEQLKALGVRIAVDDFGMGYSCLAQLCSFTVDEIKVDRAFVSGVDRATGARSIVRSIIDLGHGLGCVVTAEGVETPAADVWLRAASCDAAQGYRYARPAPWTELLNGFRDQPSTTALEPTTT